MIRFSKSDFGLFGGDRLDKKVCSQLVELNCLYTEIEDIFHNLARHYELSDSALWILYFMRESCKIYTQKEISEMLSSSKQTIHSALKTLEAAGYIKLEFSADNRKNKRIILTSSGKAFAALAFGIQFKIS